MGNCIAIEAAWLLEGCIAIQSNRQQVCIAIQTMLGLGKRQGSAILQYSHYTCDTALGERACWACRARARLGVLGAGAAGAGARRASGCKERWRARGRASGRRAGERQARWARGARRARQARWARGAWQGAAAGARAGQDCALGALDLIFKPVFRLSIFPESINEHCSL